MVAIGSNLERLMKTHRATIAQSSH